MSGKTFVGTSDADTWGDDATTALFSGCDMAYITEATCIDNLATLDKVATFGAVFFVEELAEAKEETFVSS